MNNHYHTIGYLRMGKNLGEMMRKIHGSVAEWGIIVPHYVTIIGSLFLLLSVLVIARKSRPSRIGNLCSRCGYDLRASENRCPECGHNIEKSERKGHPISEEDIQKI